MPVTIEEANEVISEYAPMYALVLGTAFVGAVMGLTSIFLEPETTPVTIDSPSENSIVIEPTN